MDPDLNGQTWTNYFKWKSKKQEAKINKDKQSLERIGFNIFNIFNIFNYSKKKWKTSETLGLDVSHIASPRLAIALSEANSKPRQPPQDLALPGILLGTRISYPNISQVSLLGPTQCQRFMTRKLNICSSVMSASMKSEKLLPWSC